MGKGKLLQALKGLRREATQQKLKRPSRTVISDGSTCPNGETKKRTIEFHKSKGQHILVNEKVLKAIVKNADVRETDSVMEIGPGTGNLTMELLNTASKVIAVEIDQRMISFLQERANACNLADKLQLIQGDILRRDLPDFDICVANIPYQISSPLIFKLLAGPPKFRSATLMFQKEFASRLVAQPGESCYNRLTVNVNLLAKCKHLMDVGKGNFVPTPKVDSSVVKIEPHAWPPPADLAEWNAFTRLCFTRKNKTLSAILKQKSTLYNLMMNAEMHFVGDTEGKMTDSLDLCSLFAQSDKEVTDDEEEEALETNDENAKKLTQFKEKLIGILKERCLEGKRPSKLSQDEFLGLLALFNKEGVYFS